MSRLTAVASPRSDAGSALPTVVSALVGSGAPCSLGHCPRLS
jgi:hypothetical protein